MCPMGFGTYSNEEGYIGIKVAHFWFPVWVAEFHPEMLGLTGSNEAVREVAREFGCTT